LGKMNKRVLIRRLRVSNRRGPSFGTFAYTMSRVTVETVAALKEELERIDARNVRVFAESARGRVVWVRVVGTQGRK
jgi:hypothetical protein